MTSKFSFDIGQIFHRITEHLGQHGIELENDLADLDLGFDVGKGKVKVVCVAPGLKKSVDEMGRKQRDQVVMVRVDQDTLKQLDDWVTTGAVKSRSEAAALFIREGLSVRSDELDALNDALRDVEAAQERLKNKASEIFGNAEAGAAGEGDGAAEAESAAEAKPSAEGDDDTPAN